MTIELTRPHNNAVTLSEGQFANPGLTEAYSAHFGLRFAGCHRLPCELDIIDEVIRLNPHDPDLARFRHLLRHDSGRAWDLAAELDLDDRQTTAPDSQRVEYEYRLLDTGTPVVDRHQSVKHGWQYIELLLEMYGELRRDSSLVHEASPQPLLFSGRLYVQLRWDGPTTPLIVTLGTHGRWSRVVPPNNNSVSPTDINELGRQAICQLRDTYRGKNIRDMIPKLTSDLLPPPAVDEITTE